MNSLSCPHCGTSLNLSLQPAVVIPSEPPRRGRPPKPKPAPFIRTKANTVSVSHWLDLGGPLGFGRGHLLPGSVLKSPDVFERYHHWATRFGRPLMAPAVFGQVMRRLGVTGDRDRSSRFFVFPPDLDLSSWVSQPCPRESELPPPATRFNPEKLPWVRGLRELAAAEPDNPEWPALLEALPGRNFADPLNPSPEWLIPYDAPLPGPSPLSSAAGGAGPAVSASVEAAGVPEPVSGVSGPEGAAGGLTVFASAARAYLPSS